MQPASASWQYRPGEVRQKNRLRFLVREAAGGRDALEAFRTSFGLKDLDELSDRVCQQIAERHGVGPATLYEQLLRKHMIHLALLRVNRDRREEVKEQFGLPSDEALGARIVEDLMRDRQLAPEEAHEHLLRVTLHDRCVEAVCETLASTGAATEEFGELLVQARIDGVDGLLERVHEVLREIDIVDPVRLEAGLAVASSASPVELAMFLVALEIRGCCLDSGGRQAQSRSCAIRGKLAGTTGKGLY